MYFENSQKAMEFYEIENVNSTVEGTIYIPMEKYRDWMKKSYDRVLTKETFLNLEYSGYADSDVSNIVPMWYYDLE